MPVPVKSLVAAGLAATLPATAYLAGRLVGQSNAPAQHHQLTTVHGTPNAPGAGTHQNTRMGPAGGTATEADAQHAQPAQPHKGSAGGRTATGNRGSAMASAPTPRATADAAAATPSSTPNPAPGSTQSPSPAGTESPAPGGTPSPTPGSTGSPEGPPPATSTDTAQ